MPKPPEIVKHYLIESRIWRYEVSPNSRSWMPHREDGPAIEEFGNKYWCLNGKEFKVQFADGRIIG